MEALVPERMGYNHQQCNDKQPGPAVAHRLKGVKQCARTVPPQTAVKFATAVSTVFSESWLANAPGKAPGRRPNNSDCQQDRATTASDKSDAQAAATPKMETCIRKASENTLIRQRGRAANDYLLCWPDCRAWLPFVSLVGLGANLRQPLGSSTHLPSAPPRTSKRIGVLEL